MINLQISEKELKALLDMAEENAITCGGSGDENDDPFADENLKRIKIINKMLKRNKRDEIINF